MEKGSLERKKRDVECDKKLYFVPRESLNHLRPPCPSVCSIFNISMVKSRLSLLKGIVMTLPMKGDSPPKIICQQSD